MLSNCNQNNLWWKNHILIPLWIYAICDFLFHGKEATTTQNEEKNPVEEIKVNENPGETCAKKAKQTGAK